MDTRWLDDFIALARTRHFSRAADEQNVSQPTFSRRIKLLEEEMGTTLINRQTLPLSLTPAGEEFLGLCQQISERIRLTRERIGHLGEEQARHLTIAAPQSLVSHFLPAWMAAQRQASQLTPYLRATGWLIADYFQALERAECDLALCYWPMEPVELDLDVAAFPYRVIGDERLVPLCAPDDQGRPRFALPGSRRAPLPMLAYHQRGLTNAAITAHLARLRSPGHFTVLTESVQSSNIRELLGLGHGVGWLPLRAAQADLDRGRLVRAGDERWDVPLELRLYRHPTAHRRGLDDLWARLAEPLDA